MIGTRIEIRLIRHTSAPQPVTIDLACRVTGVGHEPEAKHLAASLFEIETLVNEQLPHLRLHISIPSSGE